MPGTALVPLIKEGCFDADNRNALNTALTSVVANTPGLVGVAATAPYFHDGRAKDLAELIEIAEQVGMGKVDHLSASEKADLEAYLRSL